MISTLRWRNKASSWSTWKCVWKIKWNWGKIFWWNGSKQWGVRVLQEIGTETRIRAWQEQTSQTGKRESRLNKVGVLLGARNREKKAQWMTQGSSESEGLDDYMYKREQAEDIKKATRSDHRSYSRVVQVQLPRPREDQHVGKSKSEERKSDDRPAWARRTTPPAWESNDDSWAFVTKKETDGEESRSVCWKLGHRNYRRLRAFRNLFHEEQRKKEKKPRKFSM